MTRKQRRLFTVAAVGGVVALAATLVLTALSGTITYFYAPSDLVALDEPPARPIRIGGLVAEGTVAYLDDGVEFAVTDTIERVTVRYAGVLPDLFREGQGVIATGRVGADGVVLASQILAKHDENYLPPEVAEALKKTGQWRPETGAAPPAAPEGR